MRGSVSFSLLEVCLLSVLVSGCSPSAPSNDTIKRKLLEQVPAYVGIGAVELERVGDDNGVKSYNFKTSLTPKETLYSLEEKVPKLGDTPEIANAPEKPSTVRLLRTLQKSGEVISLYGSFGAVKKVDQWQVDSVTFDFDLNTLGQPKGNFGPGTLVAGTAEAQEALARQQREIAAYRAAIQELAAKQAQDKEQKAAAEQTKSLAALKTGTIYRGTLTRQLEQIGAPESQEISLTVTEQNGSVIRFDVSNPSTKEQQSFVGDIQFGRKEGLLHASPAAKKSADPRNARDRSRWSFYFGTGSMDLNSDVLEGQALIGGWNLDSKEWQVEPTGIWGVGVKYELRLTRQESSGTKGIK